MYTLEIYQLNPTLGTYTRIDTIDTYKNLSFTDRLNGIGSCSFTLSVYDPKASQANLIRFRNHVVIKKDSVIKWFGPITNVTSNFVGIEGEINVECNSMLFHLKTRYTAKLLQITATDQSTILWNLINTTQGLANGKLGITLGASPATTSRDSTYQYKDIAGAIIDMTNIIGGIEFDFQAVTSGGMFAGCTFNTYVSKGTTRSDLPALKIDSNMKMIQTATKDNIFNDLIVEGEGTGAVLISTGSDSASQSAYSRREEIIKSADISLQSTLDTKTSNLLNFYKVEGSLVEMELYPTKTPTLDDLNLGDIHTLNIALAGTGGYLDMVKQARLWEYTVNIDVNGVEKTKPKFILIN
jgi:hypothetical protein